MQKHILKGFKQNHPNHQLHLSTKPEKRQARSARKTLPWLFSQASSVPFSQGHRAEENSQILEISDDPKSENHLEAEPGELQNDLPLSDPISEFSSLREPLRVGNSRAANSGAGSEVPPSEAPFKGA